VGGDAAGIKVEKILYELVIGEMPKRTRSIAIKLRVEQHEQF